MTDEKGLRNSENEAGNDLWKSERQLPGTLERQPQNPSPSIDGRQSSGEQGLLDNKQ